MLALFMDTNSLLVCFPTLRAVPLRLCANSLRVYTVVFPVNTPPNDDDIATRFHNHLPGRPVLLSHSVSSRVHSDSWSKDKEIFVRRRLSCSQTDAVHALLGDEADYKVSVGTSYADCLLSIRAGGEATLGTHLCQEQKASAQRETNGFEAGDNGRPGDGVCVRDMRPARDLVDPCGVLKCHSVPYTLIRLSWGGNELGTFRTNVREFSVFKDEEIMLLAECLETLDHGWFEILDNVYVGL